MRGMILSTTDGIVVCGQREASILSLLTQPDGDDAPIASRRRFSFQRASM